MPSTPFQNVLVPVDFSPLSGHALRYAAGLAHCPGTQLTAMYAHTFSPPPYFTEDRIGELKQQFRDSFADAERSLREFVGGVLGAGVSNVAIQVIEGLPADAIFQQAAGSGADLIVMGTHGRSGVNRWMLGSVAEHVLRRSHVPVLTVREGSIGTEGLRRIICPVNDTPLARRVLALAVELAGCMGASLEVLYVKEPGSSGQAPDLCAWLPDQDRGKCKLEETTREGEAAAEIVMAAGPGDLVVMGARHRAFFDSTVMGTTAVRVVRHSRGPVLTVMERDD
jgi:nucleotide-binding universal stress UspA family protein